MSGAVSDWVIRPGLKVAISVPSVGAPAVRYCTDLRLAAPGMFCTTTVGLPGMWRPRWRASSARIDVVAAAGREADHDPHGLALVEARGVLRDAGAVLAMHQAAVASALSTTRYARRRGEIVGPTEP